MKTKVKKQRSKRRPMKEHERIRKEILLQRVMQARERMLIHDYSVNH